MKKISVLVSAFVLSALLLPSCEKFTPDDKILLDYLKGSSFHNEYSYQIIFFGPYSKPKSIKGNTYHGSIDYHFRVGKPTSFDYYFRISETENTLHLYMVLNKGEKNEYISDDYIIWEYKIVDENTLLLKTSEDDNEFEEYKRN